MDVQVQSYGTYQIFFIKGAFDDKDAHALRITLENAFKAKIPYLLLDCKEVTGVSATGLRLLLSYLQRFKETKVKVIMFHLPPDLLKLVTSCSFDSVVTVTDYLSDALQIIKRKI